jgi:predicted acylesterase/phospholipase RssA
MTDDDSPGRDAPKTPPPIRTLTLSGGGFRATLFHLGVVRALRHFDQLGHLKDVFSVSGGSILAAHLLLNWESYCGASEEAWARAAARLVTLTRSDVRGRLVRRWVLLGWLPRYWRVRQLERAYDRLYEGHILADLPSEPRLHILATSMDSGGVCTFTSSGLSRTRIINTTAAADSPESEATPETMRQFEGVAYLAVARAVAASSAFPPLFAPVSLPARLVPGGEVLTDGGVFENLGVRAAASAEAGDPLLISDASGAFTPDERKRYRFIVGRTVRTTEILMNRVAALESAARRATAHGPTHMPIVAHIAATVGREEVETAQSKAIQQLIRLVRTDLDVFSPEEADAIYLHGLEVGTAALLAAGYKVPRPPERWTPSGGYPIAAMREGRPDPGGRPTDPNIVAVLEKSYRRRWRLWSYKDSASWATVLVALGLAWWGWRLSFPTDSPFDARCKSGVVGTYSRVYKGLPLSGSGSISEFSSGRGATVLVSYPDNGRLLHFAGRYRGSCGWRLEGKSDLREFAFDPDQDLISWSHGQDGPYSTWTRETVSLPPPAAPPSPRTPTTDRPELARALPLVLVMDSRSRLAGTADAMYETLKSKLRGTIAPSARTTLHAWQEQCRDLTAEKPVPALAIVHWHALREYFDRRDGERDEKAAQELLRGLLTLHKAKVKIVLYSSEFTWRKREGANRDAIRRQARAVYEPDPARLDGSTYDELVDSIVIQPWSEEIAPTEKDVLVSRVQEVLGLTPP